MHQEGLLTTSPPTLTNPGLERSPLAFETLVPLETARQWLEQFVSGQRYWHSIGVYEKAVEMALGFNLPKADVERVALAALVHDVAKLQSPDTLLNWIDTHGLTARWDVTEEERVSPQTLHPIVGAHWVETQLNVTDEEVLRAIRYHTTAAPAMGVVEKIVYIADKIEERTRTVTGPQHYLYEARQHVVNAIEAQDLDLLDRPMVLLLDETLRYLLEKGQVIHPRSLMARNERICIVCSPPLRQPHNGSRASSSAHQQPLGGSDC